MVYWFEAIGWVKREGRCWIRGDVSVLSLCNHNKEEFLARGGGFFPGGVLAFLSTTLWRVEDISLFSGPAASAAPSSPTTPSLSPHRFAVVLSHAVPQSPRSCSLSFRGITPFIPAERTAERGSRRLRRIRRLHLHSSLPGSKTQEAHTQSPSPEHFSGPLPPSRGTTYHFSCGTFPRSCTQTQTHQINPALGFPTFVLVHRARFLGILSRRQLADRRAIVLIATYGRSVVFQLTSVLRVIQEESITS